MRYNRNEKIINKWKNVNFLISSSFSSSYFLFSSCYLLLKNKKKFYNTNRSNKKTFILIFPGQGSQYIGMGKDLLEVI